MKDKSITHNMLRMQSDYSIMCGSNCMAFIEYRIAGKDLLDCINLFLSNDFKKNGKITYKYFKGKYYKRKHKIKKTFRLKREEIRHHILEEIQQNGLMSKKHKKSVRSFKLLRTFF